MPSKKYVILSDITFFILFLLVVYMILLVVRFLEDPKSNNFIPLLALYISVTAMMFSTGFTVLNNINKIHEDFRTEQFRKKEEERRDKEEVHRNKEEENQYLRNSIDMFYIPLLDLLEKYNTDLITIVNGHKYLAQPRVRYLFEIYP